MQSLKIIRRRIQSVRNTQKVTKAMKLVAAAKLRRTQRNAISARPYTTEGFEMIKRISRRAGPDAPPIMRRRAEIKKLDVLIITSDRGLCGSFNEFLLLTLLDRVDQHTSHGMGGTIYVMGKKGTQYLQKRSVPVEHIPVNRGADENDHALATRLASVFVKRFLSHESDGAYIAFNRFRSAARQEVTFWDLLPLHWRGYAPDRLLNYLFEPPKEILYDHFAHHVLVRSIEQAMLESAAAEQSARMMAMENATKNADEMIAHLTLQYNKARQSAITAELLDIVGGAEALK
jgi:F-type H+-transporting ATPase subunit gamma